MEGTEATIVRLERELSSANERIEELTAGSADVSPWEELLHGLADGAPVAIYVIQDGKFQFTNSQFYVETGFSQAEMLGRDSLTLVHPEDKEMVRESAIQMLRGERTGPYEFRVIRKGDEVRWILGTTTSMRYHGGRAALGYYMDITERKDIEEQLALQAEELTRSNSELEQFAYVASHDLQEPLRMVTSYVQLLADRYLDKLDKDADEFIDFAVDGAKRMQVLINDLLEYSRIATEGRAFEPVECDAIVDHAVANLEVAIEENGAEVSRDGLPTVMADTTQLTQLFQNLIGNAIKFRGERSPRVHVSAQPRPDDSWVFSVRDNGIGIAPDHHERIFNVFQRLHGRGQYAGTGIGLAICKKIVERHHGSIWVESKPGKWTTFSLTIPKLRGRAGDPE